MSLMMEGDRLQDWGCGKDYYSWNTSFIHTNQGDFDFGISVPDLPCWNDLLIDENEFMFSLSKSEDPSSVGEDLVQIIDVLMSPENKKVSDDFNVMDDCPPSGGEELMVYDEIFSDFSSSPSDSPCSTTVEFCSMEEDLMDVIFNESEKLRMEVSMESQELSQGLSQDWSEGNKSISGETVNTTSVSVDFDWAGLIPCSTDSAEYKGLRLVHLLTACAEAISEGAHDLVEIILVRLGELVSPIGSTMERVAYYLLQSLNRHHRHESSGHMLGSSNNSTKDPNYMGAFSLLNQAYPYIRFAHFTANQSILEGITAQGQKVHIIDFDIMEGMQWPPLMEALKSENYNIAHLKITAVRWNDDDHDDHDDNEGDGSGCSKDTGRRLSEYASSLGIPFSFQETQLENLKRKLNCKEDEIVVVNCMWELPHMLERSRKQLLDFIHGARELNPAILTVGTGPNAIVAHEKLNFSERFAQCLNNLCAVFDSVEAGLPEQYALARATVERFFMAPMMCRSINYLSEKNNEELIKVGDIPLQSLIDIALQSGFVESDISSKSIMYAKYMVKDHNEYKVEMGGNNQIFLLWQSTPLTWVSTWTQSRLS